MSHHITALSTFTQSLYHPHHHRSRIAVTIGILTLALGLPPLYRDYRAYLALGEGGFPHNVWGWLLTSATRLLKRETVSVGEYERDGNKERFLREGLGERRGERPRTGVHPVPHRQVEGIPEGRVRELTAALLPRIHASHPTTLSLTTSLHERHLPALFIHPSLQTPHPVAADAWREIAHVHSNADCSLHVILAPQDCREVIRKGWGERHPCSGRVKGLPKEYLMVYAPRDEEEVEVVAAILEAAVGFMVGEGAKGGSGGEGGL
ncbi:hypothetical protein RUND412_004786 [Rhizina undulata]